MAAAGFANPCNQASKTACTFAFKGNERRPQETWSSVSRNRGLQPVLDLNPNDSPPRIVRRSIKSRGTPRAKLGRDWNHFMRELTSPKTGVQERAQEKESHLPSRPTTADSVVNSRSNVLFDIGGQQSIRGADSRSPPFARIEAPDSALTPESDSPDERRRRLIEQGSQAVSQASRRAADTAAEASETAARLARYARRRYQERTGGIYTGTTVEDDVFPLRHLSKNEWFMIGGLLLAIASAFAWRWQAKMDDKGTRFTKFAPARPKDPNRPKLPAPLPPMPDLGTNPRQKESAEWLNMVLSKIWKVYQRALESWIVKSLQPALDDLAKPDLIGRVTIQQFYLGEEPIKIRSVQQRVSRRANDLQYNLGIRYTGGARLLLQVPIQSGPVKVDMPVGVRRLDLDAELWIKVRLVPMEPYVGSFTWAFATKPKIKLVLAPFRFVNLMNIPLISNFLLKLLTDDLPRNFELPNKVLIDLMKDRVSGPSPSEATNLAFDTGFKGELVVTLCEAEGLPVWGLGLLSDPHCILTIGQQEVRSKRDSDTSIRGKSGSPVWNQDFFFLIEDPVTQKLVVQVRDSPTTLKLDVAKGAIDLSNLPDLEPVDVWIDLVQNSGFGPSNRSRPAGRLRLRLTYKSYVDDDDEGPVPMSSPKNPKKGKTLFVDGLPEFDVDRIPDLVTNDIPVAVAKGVQKGIDALPEEIPAAIQKGIDAIPPEIPEAVAEGRERAHDDIVTVRQGLNDAVPPEVVDNVKGFQKSASDFVAEGVANAVENLGFGENNAHVEKVDPPNDIREVAIRDRSSPGPHDFAVFTDVADVSNLPESTPPPPPLKLARTNSRGSTFKVEREAADVSLGGREEEIVAVDARSPPGPVASEALELVENKGGDVGSGVGGGREGGSGLSAKELKKERALADAGLKDTRDVGDVGIKERKGIEHVSIGGREDERLNNTGTGDVDSVDIGETVKDVKNQLLGALETLKEKTTGER